MSKRDSVFAAADEMAKRGEKPTVEKIRLETGGSYTTLTPLLREWNELQAAKKLQTAPPPEDLHQVVTNALNDVWIRACASADARLNLERESMTKQTDQARKESEELQSLADRLEETVERQQGVIKDQEASMTDLKSSLLAAQQKLSEVEAALTRALMSEESLKEANSALRIENEALKNSATEDAARRDPLIEQVGVLKGQVEVLTAQNERLIKAIPGSKS